MTGFHDPVSLKEKRDQRYVGGCQRQGCLSHVGRIHKRYPLNASVPNHSGSKWLPVPQPRADAAVKRQRWRLLCRMGGQPKPMLAIRPPTCQNKGLSARPYASNQTPIMVNARLPKEKLLRQKGGNER